MFPCLMLSYYPAVAYSIQKIHANLDLQEHLYRYTDGDEFDWKTWSLCFIHDKNLLWEYLQKYAAYIWYRYPSFRIDVMDRCYIFMDDEIALVGVHNKLLWNHF